MELLEIKGMGLILLQIVFLIGVGVVIGYSVAEELYKEMLENTRNQPNKDDSNGSVCDSGNLCPFCNRNL